MWPWFWWRPWGWFWPGYSYQPYGYPWGPMPKEQEIAMLEEQERWLSSELDRVKKRLEELRE